MSTRKEKNAISTKAWKEKNKEHVSKYNKEYRKNNVEKIASYTKFSNIGKLFVKNFEELNTLINSVN